MKTFKYSLFSRLIYRYANIPVSLFLLIHVWVSIAGIYQNWIFAFPLLLNIIALVWINKFYIRSYNSFPFHIEIDNEKMICTDFFDRRKKVVLKHSDITEIKGGIFSGNKARPIYIYDEKHNIKLGFHHHLKGFNSVLTTILSNINQDLYSSLLDQVKELGDDQREKLKQKINKQKKKKSPSK